jgi:hypothetical protein
MDAALPFAEWRDEIAVELDEAKQALAASTEALHEAEIADAKAQSQHALVKQAVDALRGPISRSLAVYIRGIDEGRYDAASAVARLRAKVTHARERVADLTQSLHEVGQLMAPVAVEDQVDAA